MDIEKTDQIEANELLLSNESSKDEIYIKNRINKKLKIFDMPELERLKTEYVDYLVKIESAIIDMENERENYISKYKSIKVNINTIGQRTGISRTTIYKYKGILTEYIKNAQEKFEEDRIIKEDSESKVINELKDEIRKLQFKSLKEQRILDKIETQQKEYEKLLKQLENLKSENARLHSENEKLKIKRTEKISHLF